MSRLTIRSILAFTGAATALAAAAVAGPGGLGTLAPINLGQVSWLDMPSVVGPNVPFSEYGNLQFNYVAPTGAPSFVNIVAVGPGSTNGPTWLAKNIVLPSSSILGSPTFTTSQVVDLRGLGINRGASATGMPIQYEVFYSPVPVSLMPSGPLTQTAVIGDQRYTFGGDLNVGSATSVPGLTPPKPGTNKTPWNGDLTVNSAWRAGLPNGEQGKDQCGPAALTNSMHWLAATYPNQISLGTPAQTWNQTLGKMKTYTNWVAPTKNPDGTTATSGGIGQRDAIVGKLRFSQDPTKTFPASFLIRYQADSGLTDLGASVTVGAKTANRVGAGGAPTFSFVLNELQFGADVELSIDWLNNAGTQKQGGHVVSVIGAMTIGNKMFMWTNDDANQGQKDANGAPPANGGLRTALFHQVTIENGGYMRLSGFGGNNRIKAVYSEVPTPGAAVLLGMASLVAARRRRIAA